MREYGASPLALGRILLEWGEYMHYLYLPVKMPGTREMRLPRRLGFISPVIDAVLPCEEAALHDRGETLDDYYIYVTVRRGYAAPGNPLNRPGWHADGFGTDDTNYILSDRWPTRFATGLFGCIAEDHVNSAEQFDAIAAAHDSRLGEPLTDEVLVFDGDPDVLYRLTPSVVHSVPIIPAPGGDRGFLKVSFSRDRYNLRGNSHNYLFDYDWYMYDRSAVRNDPAYGGGDAGPQET